MAGTIALLRGVNLPGHNRLAMADLRALATSLGFADAQTLVASGNLVFASGVKTPSQIEEIFEAAAAKELGLRTEFFVRTAGEWDAAIAANPFVKEAIRDPARLAVFCLKDAPDKAQAQALTSAIKGREVARVIGRHAYIVYPDGMGTSRLTSAVIDRALETRGTARNWNTVTRLAAMAHAVASAEKRR